MKYDLFSGKNYDSSKSNIRYMFNKLSEIKEEDFTGNDYKVIEELKTQIKYVYEHFYSENGILRIKNHKRFDNHKWIESVKIFEDLLYYENENNLLCLVLKEERVYEYKNNEWKDVSDKL